jgi:hypothetical protein
VPDYSRDLSAQHRLAAPTRCCFGASALRTRQPPLLAVPARNDFCPLGRNLQYGAPGVIAGAVASRSSYSPTWRALMTCSAAYPTAPVPAMSQLQTKHRCMRQAETSDCAMGRNPSSA